MFYGREKEANEKIARMAVEFDTSPLNRLVMSGNEKVGVIATGQTYNYVMDALVKLGAKDKVAVLKLGTSNPSRGSRGQLPRASIKYFVTEEPDPFVELHVKALAKDANRRSSFTVASAESYPRRAS
jgi:TPP-dependent indolepyruvate ferredoxin oxidoreductase alpha subunit